MIPAVAVAVIVTAGVFAVGMIVAYFIFPMPPENPLR